MTLFEFVVAAVLLLDFCKGSPPVFTGERTDLIAIVGGAVKHGCVYEGSGLLGEIFWTLDGSTSILQDPRVDITGFPFGSDLVSIFEIENIDLSFTGVLTCSVVDADGNNASTSFNLTVLSPAQLSTNPTDVNTQNGSTVTLHCIANGVPFPTIDWYKDNNTLINPTEKIIISTTEFNDTLVLSNLTIVEANFNHSGSYHCTAHNVLRESINASPMIATANSASALLQVYYPVYLIDHESYAVGFAGGSVTIQCSFAGYNYPLLNLTEWYNPLQQQITNPSVISTDVYSDPTVYLGYITTSFTLNNLMLSDVGNYTCTSTNCAPDCNHTVEGYVSVTVNYPPSVSVQLDYIVVNVTDGVSIACTVYGIPQPITTWSYMSSVGENSSAISTELSIITTVIDKQTVLSSLMIENITKQQEGFYTCYGDNGISNVINSSQGVSVEVVVQVPPVVSATVSSTVYRLSATAVTLVFDISNASPPVSIVDITWTVLYSSNSTLEITNASSDPRFSFSNDLLFLTINNLQRNDSGVYSLRAGNPAGTSVDSIVLHVGVFPLLASSSGDMSVLTGTQGVTIYCNIEADPVADIVWFFNGQFLSDGGRYTINEMGTQLVIGLITYSDKGAYVCEASNVFGSINSTLWLNVQVPPSVLQSPVMSNTISAGDALSLSCTVTGHPLPIITWFKDTVPYEQGNISITNIDDTTVSSSLELSGVSLDEAGVYYCNASNDLFTQQWTTSDESIVYVLYPPNVILTSEGSVVVNASDEFQLFCDVTGLPAPTVSWYLNQDPLQNSTEFIEISISYQNLLLNLVKATSVLKILKASKAFEGNYTCIGNNTAENLIGTIDSHVSSVFVQVPPIVQSDGSSSLIAVINQSVTISFVVLNASPPVNEIQWSFVSSNEQYSLNNVDPEQYVFSPDSLSLTISIVEFSNEGNYSVTVSNPAGYSSATVNIDVQAPPVIISNISSVSVIEGDDAILHCIADSEPVHNVTWTAPNGSNIAYNNAKYMLATSQELYGILTVRNTLFSDSGQYKCTVSNIHGYNSHLLTLTIQVLPVAIVSPISSLRHDGQSLSLTCSFYGNPIPSVTWIKDDAVLVSSSVSNSSELTVYSELLLHNLTYNDTGVYYCQAQNFLVKTLSSISNFANVTVNYPVSIVHFNGAPNVTEGSAYTLVCTAFGIPLPNIVWSTDHFKEDQFVVNTTTNSAEDGFTVTSILTINSVSFYDTGDYNCTASNAANGIDSPLLVATRTMHLTVLIPPFVIVEGNVSNIIVLLNTPITITVEILNAYPPVEYNDIVWSFSDSFGSTETISNDVLTIDRLSFTKSISMFDDEGNYTVTATNPAGVSSVNVFVLVQVAPRITIPPNDVLVNEGDMAVLTCRAFSKPAYSVSWIFNNFVIATSFNKESEKYSLDTDILSYGSLTINNFTLDDLGNYTCNVSNVHGFAIATAEIMFLVAPKLYLGNDSYLTLYSQNISFSLEISNIPNPPVNIIDWYHNGLKLSSGGGMEKYVQLRMRNTLELGINDVTVSDGGNYTVVVSNEAGNDSATIELIVEMAPFVMNNGSVSLEVLSHGNSTQLECLYDGVPRPEAIWLFNGGLIQPNQHSVLSERVDGFYLRPGKAQVYKNVIFLNALEDYDSGSYLCKITNKHGSATLPQPYRIEVEPEIIDFCKPSPCRNNAICINEKSSYICDCADGWTGINCTIVALIETAPVITAGPEPIYKKLYSQVTLSCIASGNPQPGIQWFRDGLDIDGANTSQFIIKRLDLTTRGQYRCVARNHLGTASSDEVYVKIEGLAQYKVLLELTIEFIDALVSDRTLVKRQVDEKYVPTQNSLDKLLEIVTEISYYLLGEQSGNNIADYFKIELQNETNIKYFTDPIPILITVIINRDGSLMELFGDISSKLNSAIENIGYSNDIIPSNITRFDGCVDEATVNYPFDNNTEIPFYLVWAETDIGQTKRIRCPCGPEDFDIGVERFATRNCIGTFINGANWEEPDDSECRMFSLSARKLCQLASLEESDEQLNGLNDITKNTEEILSLEVSISTVFVESLNGDVQGNESLSLMYLDVVNNLLNTDDDSFMMSNNEANSSQRILGSFEDVLSSYPLNSTQDSLLLVRTRYALSLQELDDLEEGEMGDLSFTIANFSTGSNITEQLIQFEDYSNTSSASIMLPPSILNDSLVQSRIVFSVYGTEKLFFRREELVEKEQYLLVGSKIISASVYYGNDSLNDLQDPVIITLRKDNTLKEKARHTQCSFWDQDADDGHGNWSSSGCETINETNSTVVCSCNHLTTFALIMDVSPVPTKPAPVPKELSITLTTFSLIGNCVSIICLLIIIFTYAGARKLRKSPNGQLLLNLCLAFLGLNIVFIPAVLVSKHVFVLCVINGAALHYFILASFLAMASQATVLYLELVKVFATGKEGLPIKSILVTWVVPIFIVGLTLAPDHSSYANDDFCIPVGWQFIGGSIIPFGLIYVYNWIMFFIIVISITKQRIKMSTSTGNKALQSGYKKQAMLLLTLSLLFGLGWSLGLAATRSLPITALRTIFEFAFIVLTGFQGLYIFLLYGVRLRKVRLIWLKWVYMITFQHSKAARVDFTVSTQSTTGRSRPRVLGTYDTKPGGVQLGSFLSPSQQMQKETFSLSSSTPSPVVPYTNEEYITDRTVKEYLSTSTFKDTNGLSEKRKSYDDDTEEKVKPSETNRSIQSKDTEDFQVTTFKGETLVDSKDGEGNVKLTSYRNVSPIHTHDNIQDNSSGDLETEI